MTIRNFTFLDILVFDLFQLFIISRFSQLDKTLVILDHIWSTLKFSLSHRWGTSTSEVRLPLGPGRMIYARYTCLHNFVTQFLYCNCQPNFSDLFTLYYSIFVLWFVYTLYTLVIRVYYTRLPYLAFSFANAHYLWAFNWPVALIN